MGFEAACSAALVRIGAQCYEGVESCGVVHSHWDGGYTKEDRMKVDHKSASSKCTYEVVAV